MKPFITSEVNHLNSVIVHTPGREVSLLNPEHKDELLFDDIIFEEDARNEHLDMLDVFKTAMPENGKIYEICDLIKETFTEEEARAYFIERFERLLPEEHLHWVEDKLLNLPPEELQQFVIEGTTPSIPHFTLTPTPNLLFTRDLAATVNDEIILSQAAKHARLRESLLMETVLYYHPMFDSAGQNIIRTSKDESIEGGDIIVASNEVVLIGMSERTTFSGIMKVSEQLFQHEVKHVVVVDIPKQRSSMHLDTIFTFISHNECMVFPPAITERQNNIVVLSKNGDKIEANTMPSLKYALENLMNRELTFINCGGNNRTDQFREQWTDGANIFALAPGVIVGYDRNTYTFEALKEHGYTIMDQYSFVETYTNNPFEPQKAGKLAITFRGQELCRGRGGARCMTQPIVRQ